MANDLARAINYLHSHKVVHMDIKSSNVLLTAHGVAKLADVGFARTMTNTHLNSLDSWVGTFFFGKGCGLPVDIYSFGVVLWEIVTGERPQRGSMRPPVVPDECPQAVADLIKRCMAVDPSERPTARDLLRELSHLSRNHSGRMSAQLQLRRPSLPRSAGGPSRSGSASASCKSLLSGTSTSLATISSWRHADAGGAGSPPATTARTLSVAAPPTPQADWQHSAFAS